MVRAIDTRHNKLSVQKISRNKWRIATKGTSKIKVKYQYYANQLDAGGSLLDDRQLYLNFVNCLLYQEDSMDDPCTMDLLVDKGFRIACGLPRKGSRLYAKSYFHLVDSPMIASKHLKQWQYSQSRVKFHIWFLGAHKLNKNKVINAFKAFSREQIKTMGSFPEKEFHFLFQVPNLKIYHGVEHSNSTVIALGPGPELHKTRYCDFLGVSSHELFHSWNVLKIRPKELLPYNFKKEVYFETGFIAEGITTYYGDLFLVRSGVFHQHQYFKELDKLFKRHFENEGRHFASLSSSSLDLWVDGYRQGAPGRKVSIYTKGALIALMLDLTIRKVSGHHHSLDDVIRKLWEQFGKRSIGYSLNDFIKICENVAGTSLRWFFNEYVHGIVPLEHRLSELIRQVGCQLKALPSRQLSKSLFGFRTASNQGELCVMQIASGSPAYGRLSVGDRIISVNGKKPKIKLNSLIDSGHSLKLLVTRLGRNVNVTLVPGKKRFYTQYKIEKLKKPDRSQKESFNKWISTTT
jgi:predicted metalloprotease with PDZ domain